MTIDRETMGVSETVTSHALLQRAFSHTPSYSRAAQLNSAQLPSSLLSLLSQLPASIPQLMPSFTHSITLGYAPMTSH